MNNRKSLILIPMMIAIVAAFTNAAFAEKTVKVFILAGQSNMEGKGAAVHLDTYKNDPLIKPMYDIIKDGDGWAERDDVFITYPSMHSGAKHGPLTAGYGTKPREDSPSIGPEFGFGHVVGEALDDPVLIIKIAWGGKSVHKDFRPPSAMPSDAQLKQMVADAQAKYDQALVTHEEKKKAGKKSRAPKPVPTFEQLKEQYGHYYREVVRHTKEELATYKSKFPALKDYDAEIAGFIWHQGFNDKIRGEYKETKYADYTKWLAMFIKDIRKDLDAPDMPFVIGELSTGGIPSRGDFQVAQANTAKIPGLKNVVFVPTAEYYDTAAHELYTKNFWKGTDEQKAQWRAVGNDRPYHYLGSGKTYFLKGVAFGKAVLKMQK